MSWLLCTVGWALALFGGVAALLTATYVLAAVATVAHVRWRRRAEDRYASGEGRRLSRNYYH